MLATNSLLHQQHDRLLARIRLLISNAIRHSGTSFFQQPSHQMLATNGLLINISTHGADKLLFISNNIQKMNCPVDRSHLGCSGCDSFCFTSAVLRTMSDNSSLVQQASIIQTNCDGIYDYVLILVKATSDTASTSSGAKNQKNN